MNLDKRIKTLIAAGQASIEQMESAGYEAVAATKSAATPQVRMKSGDVEDLGDRVLRFRASDETADRMGDIIRQSGWHLGNYKENPVILWAHDGDAKPPVGRAVGISLEETRSGPSLMLDIEFATRKQHELADTTFELAKGGFLKANSVGFLPIKTNAPESEDERKEMGLGSYGVEFVEQELLEDSIVSVPANPSAVQEGMRDMVRRGVIGATAAEKFTEAQSVTERGWEKRLERMLDKAKELVHEEEGREIADLAGLNPLLLEKLVSALQENTKELQNLRYLQVPELLRSDPASKAAAGRENPTSSAAALLRKALQATSHKE